MSKKVTIRYLIDVAIGNPEPGVVNFNALYTVLQAISDKLDLQNEHIEIDSSFCPVASNIFDSKSNVSSERLMNQQVYILPEDEKEEKLILSKKSRDSFRNANSKDIKKAHRSVSLQDQQTAEDRKVAFGQHDNTRKNNDEDILNRHGSKKSKKNLDIRQQIDCLYDRLEKIENFAVWSVDTEQSVECLRQIVQDFQNKIGLVEQSICDLKNKRYGHEEDISACRMKLEYDKLSVVTDALRKDLNILKESINGGSPINMQMKKTHAESTHDLAEITRLDIQLIELKTNICAINEKLKSLDEIVAKTDRCSPMVTMDMFQHEISTLKIQIDNSAIQTDHPMIQELQRKLEEMVHSKIDKAEVDELLSEKADYSIVHEKVSIEIMDAEHRKFEKQLAEITDCVINNEEEVQKQIDGIKNLVGDENLIDMLHDFKLKINKEIQRVSDGLKKLSEIKPNIDSAVTRLKDLTCLSCNQDVIMKAVEVHNLSKFSAAHVSKSISPSITFEVGKLREAGRAGLYNDDDIIFELDKKFRNSGGVHTIITNKDRISKTRLRKSK